jgi:hypothetical protein
VPVSVRVVRARLLPDPAVDALTEEVGVAVVPGVLLDEVHQDLPAAEEKCRGAS